MGGKVESNMTVYSRRWFILAMYGFISAFNSANWISFAAISSDAEAYFNMNTTAINFLSVIWCILYMPGSIWGDSLMEKYKLRTTLLVGAGLTFLGTLIRVAGVAMRDAGTLSGPGAYALVFLGQSVAGLAQPIVVNLATAIGSDWFPLAERDTATTMASIFNPVGNAIGSILSPAFVTVSLAQGQDDGDATSDEVNGMLNLMVVQSAMSFGAFLLAFFFFETRPPTPPSISTARRIEKQKSLGQVAQRGSNREMDGSARPPQGKGEGSTAVENSSVYKNICLVLQNREFVYLTIAFGVGLGIINSVLTLTFQLIQPFGYTSSDAGLFGFMLIISGLVGSMIMAYMLETTRAYATCFKIGFLVCIGGAVLLECMLYSNNFPALAVAFSTLGFCVVPLFPCTLENSAECTYPLPEEIGVGVLLSIGNLSSTILTFALQYAIPLDGWGPPPLRPSSLLMTAVLVVGAYFALRFQGQTKRLDADGYGGSDSRGGSRGVSGLFAGSQAGAGKRSFSASREGSEGSVLLSEPLIARISSSGEIVC
jgi:MFS family permease